MKFKERTFIFQTFEKIILKYQKTKKMEQLQEKILRLEKQCIEDCEEIRKLKILKESKKENVIFK